MPKIINAFRGDSGVGKVLADMGKTMFGDEVTGDLKREQLYSLQRGNTELDGLMRSVQRDGSFGGLTNPDTQAQIIGSGYDPANVAALARSEASAKYGAQSTEAAEAAVGAGGAFSSTGQGFSQSLEEQQRQFNMMPTEVNQGGQNVYAPRADVMGMNAPVTGTTRKPSNYIVNGQTFLTTDGLTDVRGQPLPPGGYLGTVDGGLDDVIPKPVMNAEAGATVANQKLQQIIGMANELTTDPTLFGPIGYARTLGQELMQGAQGVVALFADGEPGAQSLSEAKEQIAGAGLGPMVPELYNPNLSKVDAVWGILLYQGAAALAGQEGRSVSDKDIQMMRTILGNPKGMFASAESMKSKLAVVQQMMSMMDNVSRGALSGDLGEPIQPPAPPVTIPTSQGDVTYEVIGD